MCDAVVFEVSAPLLGAVYCHCKRCQRRTGTAFSASALTDPGSFAITRGDDAVRTHRPADDGWHKSYCAECGSQLFTTHPENADLVAVRMGALDEDPGIRPGVHQFVDYAPPWAPVPDDGLPRFPERMAWQQT
jgi:hypothetical protein